MRKESKQRQEVVLNRVHLYHRGDFTEHYYFNSDRKEKLIRNSEGRTVRANGQELVGFGLEIESECNGINSDTALAEVYTKIIFPHFKFGAEMFKMESDCTLNGRSNAEVITQIMTKQRIRNDYAAYKTMFDTYFKAFDITCDCKKDNVGCGMHVNVSNGVFGKTEAEQTEAIRKLYYFVNKNYNMALRLFYRDERKTTWCGRMDYSNSRNLDLYNMSSSHGNCMNLSHFPEGRIEIRIVGGQKDYYCFRNTMETVFHLCERVRKISWEDLDDMIKVFSGCNQAVFRRLETECGDFLSVYEMEKIRESVEPDDIELR